MIVKMLLGIMLARGNERVIHIDYRQYARTVFLLEQDKLFLPGFNKAIYSSSLRGITEMQLLK